MTTRREFLRASACLATGTASGIAMAQPASDENPGAADEKASENVGKRMKLSLAAYSLRSQLQRAPTEDELSQAKLTMEGFVDYCATLGLDGAELTGYYFPKYVQDVPIYRQPEETQDAQTRQQAIDKAVGAINLLKNRAFIKGLDVTGTAIGNNFCVPEGPELVAQINSCKDWIDRAYVLGAPVIRIFAGTVPKGDTEDAAIKRCAAAINECLKYAARRGVFLALENHGGITATPAQMMTILDQVEESPWFGVNFDSGNFHTDDPYRDLEVIAPRAVNAQIKVSLHRDGKKERADFSRIIGILKAADYQGYIVFEYEEEEDPYLAIPRYLDELRAVVDG